MELTTRLRAGFPNNPTPRKRLVEWRGRALRGHHPLRHAHHSRGISGATRHRERFARLQFRGKPRIFKLGSSRFARRYSENPGWFLFLRLVICLNSAGNLDRLEANEKRGWTASVPVRSWTSELASRGDYSVSQRLPALSSNNGRSRTLDLWSGRALVVTF